jgi:hypothetical protein
MAKIDRLLDKSKEHLDQNEIPQAVVMGEYESEVLGKDSIRSGIFIATDRRVVFFGKKLFGYNLEYFTYSHISSIEMSKSFMGHKISFFASGNKIKMKWINTHRLKDINGFIEYVRNNMGASASESLDKINQDELNDIPSQIKKLSSLKEEGILTEEEFDSKKKELLAKL